MRGKGIIAAPVRTIVAAGLLTLAAFACGDDDGGPATTPAQTGDGPSAAPTQPPPPASPIEGMIDLAIHPAAMTIFGADSGDYLNDIPLLTTGNVNGDELDDLLIGARFGDGPGNERQDSGEAYLIYGRETLPETLDMAEGEADVIFYGAEPNDQMAFHGFLGDVNGDGLDDVVLGAPFALGGIGAVYVFFGGDLDGVIDLAERDADATFAGPHATSFFGDAVSFADVNGDGTNDILVGATFARRPAEGIHPRAQAGAAYVFFGGDIGGVRDTAAGDYDAVIYGENDDPHPDELGDNILGADVNGDGIGDVIITAEAADGPNNERSVAAEVHVVYGSPDFGGVYDIAAGDQDVTIIGAEQNDTLGFQLAAGDVNNDGVADLLMSARGGDGPDNIGSEVGEIHVVLGRSDLPAVIDLLNDESDAYVYGQNDAEMLAYTIHVLDIDGDGRNEVMVGSGFSQVVPERRRSGALYIFDASELSGAVRITDAPNLLMIAGEQETDAFGSAGTSGDLDGDGSLEIIGLAVRADRPDGSQEESGRIYVIKP